METAGGAEAPPPLADVAPMPLFPPLNAADLAGGKIEWRKARARRPPPLLLARRRRAAPGRLRRAGLTLGPRGGCR